MSQMPLPLIEIDTTRTGQLNLSDHHPIVISAGDVKVVSYNIQLMPTLLAKAEDKKTSQGISESVDKIATYLASTEVDVCCVQELFDNTANQLMQQRMREKGYVATQRVGANQFLSVLNGGVCTFVKEGIAHHLGSNEHIFQNSIDYFVGGDAIVNKGVNHTWFTKDGIKHHIFNTHLQAFYPDREHYTEIALAQCVELKKFIEDQKRNGNIGPDDKIMLCGDFNIPKPSRPEEAQTLWYAKMRQLMGPQFTFLDYAPSDEKTLSSRNSYNTNLEDNSDMDLNFDFAITYNPKFKDLKHTEPADIYCDIQLAISHYVRKHATIFSGWLLSDDKKTELDKFNQEFADLRSAAEEIKEAGENPFDNQEWFLKAVKLLRGPRQSHDNPFTEREVLPEVIAEPQEDLIDLPWDERDVTWDERDVTLELFKEKYGKLLNNLRGIHDEIHSSYISSPEKNEAIFMASLKLHHTLMNAGEKFFEHPTYRNFFELDETINKQLGIAKDVFSEYYGIWGKIHPIFKALLGLIAAAALLPVLLIEMNEKYGFRNTFFKPNPTIKNFDANGVLDTCISVN